MHLFFFFPKHNNLFQNSFYFQEKKFVFRFLTIWEVAFAYNLFTSSFYLNITTYFKIAFIPKKKLFLTHFPHFYLSFSISSSTINF